jgi:prepilin-type N-terminal cleavage/methylation domain-containing protein
MPRKRAFQGFTLIELMVVVGIMGVLSSVAIPSFTRLMNRSKTAEVAGNLDSMYKSAASYYTSERSGQGQISTVAGHCSVDDALPSPSAPLRRKQVFPSNDTFRTLGFNIADLVYFSYGLASGPSGVGRCDNVPSESVVYTLFANGDLDGDGLYSTFELAAGSDPNNVLYHARGLHVVSELE